MSTTDVVKPVMRVCVNGQINKCLFYVNDITDSSAENNYCSCITRQLYTLPNKNGNIFGLHISLLYVLQATKNIIKITS